MFTDGDADDDYLPCQNYPTILFEKFHIFLPSVNRYKPVFEMMMVRNNLAPKFKLTPRKITRLIIEFSCHNG